MRGGLGSGGGVKPWERLPLRLQWALVAGLVCVLVVLGSVGVSVARWEERARRELGERSRDMAELVALAVAPALEREDGAEAQRQLESVAVLPEALFGVLLREDGTPLGAWHPERVPHAARRGEEEPARGMTVRRSVPTRGGARGTLLLGLSGARLEEELRRSRHHVAAVTLALLGLGLAVLLVLSGVLTRPLERVTRALEGLSERASDAERGSPGPSSRDEAQRLRSTLGWLEQGVREQVSLLENLVEEARGFQERVYVQQRLLDTRHDELRLLRDQLVVADRRSAVGTLSAGVAHEINNPLAYITANTQFALQELRRMREDFLTLRPEGESDWDEVVNALTEASDGCSRVQHIVLSLKSFSCGDDGRQQAIELVSSLKTAINMASNEIRHRARLVHEPSPQVRVEANEVRLAQVFLNLLINAAQAIAPGAVEDNEIRISTRQGPEGDVRVSITDTGSGMTPEVRERLFTPFFTTKPIGVGTGLGLSVCQGLVRGMGGHIEVRSEPGRGSTFTVVLPAATGPSGNVVAHPATSLRPARARLLVVDDEPRVGISLRRALSREHEVVLASGGREALARLCQGAPFDVILCDLMMPEMNGMELFAELERLHPAQASRVLFLTGGAVTEQGRAFVEEHSERVLLKPMDMDALRERLRLASRPGTPRPAAEFADRRLAL
jgi:signal transduction histidine kinase/ActR/RegA family two-component response regulator